MNILIAIGFIVLGIACVGLYVFNPDKEHGFQWVEEGLFGIGILALVLGAGLIFYPPEVF